MGLSLRVIGSKVGVSGQTISVWAKEGGWVKGMVFPVVEAAQAAMPTAPASAPAPADPPVVEVVGEVDESDLTPLRECQPEAPVDAPVDASVNQGHDQPLEPPPETPLDQRFRARVRELLENPTRDEAVDVAARAVVQVVHEHRRGVIKAQMLCDRLLGQLDIATVTRGELEEFIVNVTEPGKYRSMLMKLVQLPAHAGVLRDLATAQTKLVQLERQAFGLSVNDDPVPLRAPKEAPAVPSTEFDRIRERVQLRLAGGTQA